MKIVNFHCLKSEKLANFFLLVYKSVAAEKTTTTNARLHQDCDAQASRERKGKKKKEKWWVHAAYRTDGGALRAHMERTVMTVGAAARTLRSLSLLGLLAKIKCSICSYQLNI